MKTSILLVVSVSWVFLGESLRAQAVAASPAPSATPAPGVFPDRKAANEARIAARLAAQKAKANGEVAAAGVKIKPDKIVYKTTPQGPLELTFYKPEGWKASDHRPALVFIHGGGWIVGGPRAALPFAQELCPRGMVVFSVGYRLAERGPGEDPSNCIEDSKSAMSYVRAHAAELGIDPQRIAAAGSSAGGHLAAACALLPGFEPADAVSCKPNALVLLQPVLDNGPDGGYGYDLPVIHKDYMKFSPAHHVVAGAPPTVIFGGRSDYTARLSLLHRFNDAMKKSGNDCEIYEYDGVHGFAGRPPALPDILDKTTAFLIRLGWIPYRADAGSLSNSQLPTP